MHKSTKILLSVFLLLFVGIGTFFLLYKTSPLPEVKGSYIPHVKQEVSYNAPLSIVFSNRMNQKSTENAFKIAPETKGTFEWTNGYTLTFMPKKRFAIGENVTVTILKSAKDYLGKNLVDDVEMEFKIIGAPRVVFVSPVNQAELAQIKGEEVTEAMDSKPVILPYSPSPLSSNQKIPSITVMFDRPIRALTTLDESDANQVIDFLKIEPEIDGKFKWLGTSAFQFTPTELPMSTEFKITIPHGTEILDSGFTEEDYVWHFETERPKVLSSIPYNNEQFFDPKDEIKLHFNQQVNLDTLYERLNFYPPKDGFFNGEITFEKGDLTTVIINPDPKLVHPENYTLSIQSGMSGLYGTKKTEEEIVVKFKTYEQASIKDYTPKNKATKVKNYDIAINFTTPMDVESIQTRLSAEPEVKNLDVYLTKKDTRAVVRGSFQPGQKYKLILKKGSRDKFEQMVRDDLEIEFTMADAEPYLTLMSRGKKGVFSDKITPEYYLRSINLTHVDIKLCKIDEEEFLKTEKNYDWYQYQCKSGKKWIINLAENKNVYQTNPLPLEEKIDGKGIYYLSVSSPQYHKNWGNRGPYFYNQVFFITNTALSLKYNKNESLVWATDMVSGKPIENMQVRLKNLYTNELITEGKTNADGLLQTKLNSSDRFYVFAEKNDQWGIVGSDWTDGISSWDFGISRNWYEDERSFGYLYTDRPIYRPDQEVYFKGIVRKENDVKFSIPEDTINVSIEDSYGNMLFEKDLPLNQNGSFNGNIKLDASALLGRYYFYANYKDNYFNRSFWVEEYRKPDFKVDVTAKKTDFVNQEKFKAEIDGSYYFGGALANAPVDWTISSDNYYFDQYDGEWYNFSADDTNYWGCGWWNDCASEQNIIAEGSGKLNANGKINIEHEIDLSDKTTSQLYTISATVSDLNNQSVTKQETFIIHKGNYYVGIKNENYVGRTGEKTNFKIITVDYEGNPLKNKTVNVDFYKREWNSVKKEGIDGSFYWESENTDTLVASEKANTDSNGKATIGFTPQDGGYYIAKATSIDSDGNKIMAQGSVYISGPNYIGWGVQNHDRIDLVLDKASYKVGDTANILVKSPFEDKVNALFTTERLGVISSQILTFDSNSEIIKLPITEDMLPNVYASVLIFKGSGDLFQIIELQKELPTLEAKLEGYPTEKEEIEKEILALKLEVKQTLENGYSERSARYNIKNNKLNTTENKLKEIEEKHLELLDQYSKKETELKTLKKEVDSDTLAKLEAGEFSEYPRPEFKLGYANILVNTENKRLNLNLETNQERYHAGDTVNLKVKTTDQSGAGVPAEVSIAVVDESILALKSRNLEDLVDFFYERRGLKIDNAQSLVYFIERLNVKAQKGEKGGGGGNDESLLNEKRGDFKDTAFWEPNLETDENGLAEIEFKLPDNLTTWQILAIGATKETIVGSTEKDFISTQDLIVRPVLPRFLVMNDTVEIGTIVHNNTGDTENVKVTLSGENFVNTDEDSYKVSIQDGEEAKVTWKIKVNQGASENFSAKFNFKAEASQYKDEVEMSLPVKAFSIPEVVATNAVTTDLAKEQIYLPESINPTMGEITVGVTPTLATNLKDGLEFLAKFPYGCAEQTMSRHLPNVVLKQLNNIIPLEGDKGGVVADTESLNKMVSEGLQKLYQFQRYDGGWGYWIGSDYSYPYLSAYVLFGLNETKNAGYTVDEKVIEKGTLYLKQYLNNPEQFSRYHRLSLDNQAFALWVMSQSGNSDLALSLKLMDQNDQLSLYAKAYMLMNFMEISRSESNANVQNDLQQKIGALKSELENNAIVDTRGIHFEEKEQNYWSMNSNTRTTAIILKALVQNDVQDPLIPNIMNWLRTQKKDGHWSNTQETVWALLAFTDYFTKSGELNANYNVKVTINDKEKINENFNSDNLFTRTEFIQSIENLRIGTPLNEIFFNKEGEGNLYYDITSKYYLPLEEIPERSEGLTLIRQYSELNDEDETPVSSTKVGDILKGKLTIIAPEDRHFVLVEEFLPAGFEAINFNLETENQNLQSEINQNQYNWWENGIWRFYHREFRDDRISLFADYLPAGIYEYEFVVRVTSAGTFHHLPAQAYEMYFPENFGRTNGEIIEIKE